MYCTSKYFLKRDVLHPNLSHDVLASICDLHLYVCVSTCLPISYSINKPINQTLRGAAILKLYHSTITTHNKTKQVQMRELLISEISYWSSFSVLPTLLSQIKMAFTFWISFTGRQLPQQIIATPHLMYPILNLIN